MTRVSLLFVVRPWDHTQFYANKVTLVGPEVADWMLVAIGTTYVIRGLEPPGRGEGAGD